MACKGFAGFGFAFAVNFQVAHLDFVFLAGPLCIKYLLKVLYVKILTDK